MHSAHAAHNITQLHKEAHATEFYFGRVLAERMMARDAEVPKLQVSERVRDVVKGVTKNVLSAN